MALLSTALRENELECFLKVRKLQKTLTRPDDGSGQTPQSLTSVMDMALELYETYIKPSTPLEIALPHDLRNDLATFAHKAPGTIDDDGGLVTLCDRLESSLRDGMTGESFSVSRVAHPLTQIEDKLRTFVVHDQCGG